MITQIDVKVMHTCKLDDYLMMQVNKTNYKWDCSYVSSKITGIMVPILAIKRIIIGQLINKYEHLNEVHEELNIIENDLDWD